LGATLTGSGGSRAIPATRGTASKSPLTGASPLTAAETATASRSPSTGTSPRTAAAAANASKSPPSTPPPCTASGTPSTPTPPRCSCPPPSGPPSSPLRGRGGSDRPGRGPCVRMARALAFPSRDFPCRDDGGGRVPGGFSGVEVGAAADAGRHHVPGLLGTDGGVGDDRGRVPVPRARAGGGALGGRGDPLPDLGVVGVGEPVLPVLDDGGAQPGRGADRRLGRGRQFGGAGLAHHLAADVVAVPAVHEDLDVDPGPGGGLEEHDLRVPEVVEA